MKVSEAKRIAKDMLTTQLSAVYYQFENYQFENIPEEDHDIISKYIEQYGNKMCKAIGEEFYA